MITAPSAPKRKAYLLVLGGLGPLVDPVADPVVCLLHPVSLFVFISYRFSESFS